MAKKRNKFDKIEQNENYIAPENQGKTDQFDKVETTQQGTTETAGELYHDRKKSRTGSGLFYFKKKTSEYYEKEENHVNLLKGIIKPHILMLCVLIMCVMGALVADSSFYNEFEGISLCVSYALTYVVIYIVPCVIYMLCMKKKPSQVNMRSFEPSQSSFVFVSLVLLLCMTALVKYYIAYTFSYRTTESIPEGINTLYTVVVVALVPAVCEEIFVHGVLQSEYSKYGGGVSGILVGAVVFSLIHFNLQYFVVYLVAGLVLGVVTHMTGSVFPAMILHFMNNLFAVLFADSITFIASERIGGAFIMIVLTILSLVLLIIQLQMMEKTCRTRALKLSKENEIRYDLFVSPDGATGKRLLRLLFSPAIILAFIIFSFVV